MKRKTVLLLSSMVLLGLSPLCWAQDFGAAITYQGRLTDKGNPANDMYDFSFQLYDAATLGHPVNLIPIEKNDVNVYQGYFTVTLDFGAAAFNGDARWLQIGVRPFKSTGAYTPLAPRQELTPNPYSLYAAKSAGLVLPFEGSASCSAPALKVTNTGAGNAIEGRGQNNDGVVGAAFVGGRSGVFGFNDHADGFGVFGSSINGAGVKGYTFGATGSGGLFEIENASNSNPALKAVTNSSTGYAGYFEGRTYFSDNVGIGTTSPSAPLSITPVLGADIEFTGSAYNADIKSTNQLNIGTTNTTPIHFITDDFYRLTINGAGDVGIGTTSPTRKLEVRGDSSNYMGYFNNTATGTNSPYGICASADARATSTESSHAAVLYSWGGATGGSAHGLTCYTYANGNSNAIGVLVDADGGATTGREYAFYGQGDGYFSGQVGIGIGASEPTAKLDVRGTIKMKDGNQAEGKIMVSDADGNAAWKNGRKYSLCDNLNTGSLNATSTWAKIKDFVIFTKDNAATDIEVVMNTRVDGGTFASGATGIKFEIRIDDNSATFDNKGSIRTSDAEEFLSIIAVFQSLSAGNHTVSVWARTNTGTSNGVLLDPGGWSGAILVKEVW